MSSRSFVPPRLPRRLRAPAPPPSPPAASFRERLPRAFHFLPYVPSLLLLPFNRCHVELDDRHGANARHAFVRLPALADRRDGGPALEQLERVRATHVPRKLLVVVDDRIGVRRRRRLRDATATGREPGRGQFGENDLLGSGDRRP